MHLVVLQVAEGGGITVPAREEVLVYAENPRTIAADALSRQQTEKPPEPALDGGAGDPFPSPQAAAADTVEVLLTDAPPETLTGPQARQNTGKTLPECTLAFQTTPLLISIL